MAARSPSRFSNPPAASSTASRSVTPLAGREKIRMKPALSTAGSLV